MLSSCSSWQVPQHKIYGAAIREEEEENVTCAKKILHLQENLAFAKKSCQSKKFVHLQQNLANARISFH